MHNLKAFGNKGDRDLCANYLTALVHTVLPVGRSLKFIAFYRARLGRKLPRLNLQNLGIPCVHG
jgi:hypothetical protein